MPGWVWPLVAFVLTVGATVGWLTLGRVAPPPASPPTATPPSERVTALPAPPPAPVDDRTATAEPPAPAAPPAPSSPVAVDAGRGGADTARAARALRQAKAAFDAGRYREAEREAGIALAADPSNRDARALVARIATLEREHVNVARGRMEAAKTAALAASAGELAPELFTSAEREEAQARAEERQGRLAAASARMEATATLFNGATAHAKSQAEARDARARAAAEDRRRAEQAAAARPVPPPAPPPPVAPPPRPEPVPAPSSAAAHDAVAAALERYAAALEQRDIKALKAVWPGLGGDQQVAIEADFGNARSIDVNLANPRIEVSGSAATATVLRHYSLRTRDGQQLRSETITTVTLRQDNGGWLIESVRHRAAR
jgi:hypothetical protein